MSDDDLKALYRRWLLELWQGGEAVAQEILTPDFVIHQARMGPDDSTTVRGPQAAVELVRMSHAPFSELTISLEVGPIVDGDMVAARWSARGIYAGGIPGATAAPGTVVEFGGIDLMRVANGRFAEYWVSSDGLALMAQLGALG